MKEHFRLCNVDQDQMKGVSSRVLLCEAHTTTGTSTKKVWLPILQSARALSRNTQVIQCHPCRFIQLLSLYVITVVDLARLSLNGPHPLASRSHVCPSRAN